MKALFTYDYGQEQMEAIARLGYELDVVREKEAAEYSKLPDVDVLVCYNPFDTLDITKMKGLKWIQLSSIGVDQIPREAVEKQGIIVTNNRGGYSIPMGEWIISKILEIYKKSNVFYRQQQQALWRLEKDVLELYGKKVAFIGTGSIAKEAAKRLQGFEVEIIGVNTDGHSTEFFHHCYGIDELNHVLKISDVVVITIPYTAKTHHLINFSALGQMKEEAVLINVSRGSIIDQQALVKSLEGGKFLGVALDVFEEEPLSQDHPLWQMERVLISPHNSWVSEMRNERKYQTILENMRRFKDNEPLLNVVNLNKGY
ncbi:phosphoglycerate dehydrogenase [Alkaliphilus crotonatoxidans]